MTHIGAERIMPEGVTALNPSFDVTPGELITAFITERGLLHPPFDEDLAEPIVGERLASFRRQAAEEPDHSGDSQPY